MEELHVQQHLVNGDNTVCFKDCLCCDDRPLSRYESRESLCSCSGDNPLVPTFDSSSEIHLYPDIYNGCELQLCYWQGTGNVDLAAVVLVEVVVRNGSSVRELQYC